MVKTISNFDVNVQVKDKNGHVDTFLLKVRFCDPPPLTSPDLGRVLSTTTYSWADLKTAYADYTAARVCQYGFMKLTSNNVPIYSNTAYDDGSSGFQVSAIECIDTG